MPGSYIGRSRGAEDPYGSNLSLGGQSDQGDSAGSEPLFNFRSLAEVVGVSIDGEGSQAEDSTQNHASKLEDHSEAHGEHVEHVERTVEPSPGAAETGSNDKPKIEIADTRTYTPGTRGELPPDVVITPDTPAPVDSDNGDSKQLGHFDRRESSREVTQ